MESLFQLHNASCSYKQDINERVLFIPQLEIPKGKITFLLGASGSGKSTLLETLGLMNNTLVEGKIDFIPGAESNRVTYEKLWAGNEDAKVASIRKKHFSFIFQNTNLMENFTAYQNICLSSMIKNNTGQTAAMQGATVLMEKVKLSTKEVPYHKLAVNLSGGQRQRVSFVRALNTPFTVLFGDEPTGNLDEANANELMALLQSNLHEQSAAIIVSHDINLAVKYADMIAVITKDPGKGYGETKEKNIFNRDQWIQKDSLQLDAFKENIRQLYRDADPKKEGASQASSSPIKNTTYRKLFLEKESKALFGKAGSNLVVLSLIMFFTFLALGFANGSLAFLETKLSDAFVNWLTVKIPFEKSGSEFQHIQNRLNEDDVKNRFAFKSATSYLEYNLAFYNRNAPQEYDFVKGRTIVAGTDADPILAQILKQDNRLYGDSTIESESDFGLIVTKSFLVNHGYPEKTNFIVLAFPAGDENVRDKRIEVPVPVRAVVKEIPGKNQFISTVSFYTAYLQGDDNTFDIRKKKKNISFFVEGDKKLAGKLKEEVETFLSVSSLAKDFSPEVGFPVEHRFSCGDGFDILINFSPAPETDEQVNAIVKQILVLPAFSKNQKSISRFYDFTDTGVNEGKELQYDLLCINFTKLDSVENFGKFLMEFNGKDDVSPIQVDSASILEKKNFNIMSKITWIISVLLLLFALICISLFISNILKMHLNKVKMNLGTFKAFGLSNKETQNIYLLIMGFFISLCIVISLALALPAGYFLDHALAVKYALDTHTNYFLVDKKIIFIFLFIFLIAMGVSWYHIRKLLSKSPGDLIYNR